MRWAYLLQAMSSHRLGRPFAFLVATLLAACGGATLTTSPTPAITPASTAPASPTAPAPERTRLAPATIPPCSAPDALDCLATAAEFIAAQGDFGGVVLVAKSGRPVYQAAFGTTLSGKPVELDTNFGVASVGKMFTAVAVGKLVQAGRIELDARIDRYVPDVPLDAAGATIAQLLSHTSGMGMMSPHIPSTATPGAFSYSNAGFDLLARAAENVAGVDFEDYIEAAVFEPAGMTATGFEEPVPVDPSGSGGEQSSAGDLLKFTNALFAHRLLNAKTTRLFTTEKIAEAGGDFGYGYGFAIMKGGTDPVPSIGHLGASPHVVAAVEANPTLGYTVVIVCDIGFDKIEPALRRFQSAIGMGYWPS